MHDHLEFAHGILAEHRPDATRRIVVVVEAVDRDVVGSGALAGERQARRSPPAPGSGAIRAYARRKHGERNVVTAIDRQLGDLLVGDYRGDGGSLNIDQRHRCDDIDGFCARRQRQRHAHFDVTPSSIPMSSSVTGLNSSIWHASCSGRRERRRRGVAVRSGHRRPLDAGLHVHDEMRTPGRANADPSTAMTRRSPVVARVCACPTLVIHARQRRTTTQTRVMLRVIHRDKRA